MFTFAKSVRSLELTVANVCIWSKPGFRTHDLLFRTQVFRGQTGVFSDPHSQRRLTTKVPPAFRSLFGHDTFRGRRLTPIFGDTNLRQTRDDLRGLETLPSHPLDRLVRGKTHTSSRAKPRWRPEAQCARILGVSAAQSGGSRPPADCESASVEVEG